MRVLVVNAGSSSLKLRVLADEDKAVAPAPQAAADTRAVEAALASFGEVDAAGHRIVHGGTIYTAPVLIDAAVRQRLEALTDLAPLAAPAQVPGRPGRRAGRAAGVPAVACFDTAFHATIPAAAATYALPPQWRARWAPRRYRFHGLSHA